mmetsp:Transcript_27016/g.45392  ORF Transcript_27016/g.45392 Transcript_27016/m.45392 type:complete len:1226 (+) Transcript_27016:116-3793(+)
MSDVMMVRSCTPPTPLSHRDTDQPLLREKVLAKKKQKCSLNTQRAGSMSSLRSPVGITQSLRSPGGFFRSVFKSPRPRNSLVRSEGSMDRYQDNKRAFSRQHQPVQVGDHILVKAEGKPTFYRDGVVRDCKTIERDVKWELHVGIGLGLDVSEYKTVVLEYPPQGDEYHIPIHDAGTWPRVGWCAFIAVPCSRGTLVKSFQKNSYGDQSMKKRRMRSRYASMKSTSETPSSPFASSSWALKDSKSQADMLEFDDDAIHEGMESEAYFAWLPGFITSVSNTHPRLIGVEIGDLGDGAAYEAKYIFPSEANPPAFETTDDCNRFIDAVYKAGDTCGEINRPVVVALPPYLRHVVPLTFDRKEYDWFQGEWHELESGGIARIEFLGRQRVANVRAIGIDSLSCPGGGGSKPGRGGKSSSASQQSQQQGCFIDNENDRLYICNDRYSGTGWEMDIGRANHLCLRWSEIRSNRKMIWIRKHTRHTWDSWLIRLFKKFFDFGNMSVRDLIDCLDECLDAIKKKGPRFPMRSQRFQSHTPKQTAGNDSMAIHQSYGYFKRVSFIRSKGLLPQLQQNEALLVSLQKHVFNAKVAARYRGYALFDFIDNCMDWDQFSHCFLNSNMYMNFYNLCSTRLYTEYMASGLEKLEKEEKILKKRYRQLQCFMEVSQYNAWVCKEVVKQLKRNSFHSEGKQYDSSTCDDDNALLVNFSSQLKQNVKDKMDFYRADGVNENGSLALRNVHPLARSAISPRIAPSIDSVLTLDSKDEKSVFTLPYASELPRTVSLKIYRECADLALNYAQVGIENERRGTVLVLGEPEEITALGTIPVDNAFDKRLNHKLVVSERHGRERIRRKMNLDGMIIINGKTGAPYAHEFFSNRVSDAVHDGGARTRAAAWIAQEANCIVIKISADSAGEVVVYLGEKGVLPPRHCDFKPRPSQRLDKRTLQLRPSQPWNFTSEEANFYLLALLDDLLLLFGSHVSSGMSRFLHSDLTQAWRVHLEAIWHLIKQADTNRDRKLDNLEEFVILLKLFPEECGTSARGMRFRQYIVERHCKNQLYDADEIQSKVSAILEQLDAPYSLRRRAPGLHKAAPNSSSYKNRAAAPGVGGGGGQDEARKYAQEINSSVSEWIRRTNKSFSKERDVVESAAMRAHEQLGEGDSRMESPAQRLDVLLQKPSPSSSSIFARILQDSTNKELAERGMNSSRERRAKSVFTAAIENMMMPDGEVHRFLA